MADIVSTVGARDEMVWRRSIAQMSWDGTAHVEATEVMKFNGRITCGILKLGATNTAVNVTVTIEENELSAERFNSGAKASTTILSSTYVFDLSIDVAESITVGLDPDAGAGSATGMIADFTFYGV